MNDKERLEEGVKVDLRTGYEWNLCRIVSNSRLVRKAALVGTVLLPQT
jgi:hypothetical protein